MYPKKELEFHLANLPARSKLVCQTEIDGVTLIAVAYNYKHGITVILAAIWEGHTECVKFLIHKVIFRWN